jgi:FkbM family methyltransferase
MKSFKVHVQQTLKTVGLYDRLKASRIYDAYWSVVDNRLIERRTRETEFYQHLLRGFRSGDLIFDIGANHGHKVDIFLRLGARVVAVDPDKFNQQVLQRKFLKWRFKQKPLTIVGKAVSDEIGRATFWVDEPGSGKNTLNQKWVDTLRKDEDRFGKALAYADNCSVPTTTLDELIASHSLPLFVKIDVEGHEPSVIKGLSQPVPLLSFEVNLPEFRAEGLQCIESLGKLCPEGTFNFIADTEFKLELEHWVGVHEFCAIFEACTNKSIEIFWRTPVKNRSSGERTS